LFKARVLSYFAELQVLFPGTIPAWYTFTGSGSNTGTQNQPYSLAQTDLYGTYTKAYDALVQYNN